MTLLLLVFLFRLSCESKCSLIVASLLYLSWYGSAAESIIYCVECLIITGLSTLLTDCGVLPSLV